MLKREDVLSLGYLKKAVFRGSYRGMRFQMQKEAKEEETILKVYAWPEPFTFDKTAEELKVSQEFPFTNDGLEQSVDWLNQIHGQITPEGIPH